jgi:phosphate transport system protein
MAEELAREIDALRQALASMGNAAEARVHTAIEAWLTWDAELAASIRAADDEIDRMDVDIEERCMHVLARYQPVASDLRIVMATLRIITSLERTADLARSIAKRVIKLHATDAHTDPPQTIHDMGERVTAMLTDTMTAFQNGDIELAREVRRRDAAVDRLNREVFAWACERTESDPAHTRGHFGTIVMARALERIGDMAANIAEDTIFATGGSVVRHAPI